MSTMHASPLGPRQLARFLGSHWKLCLLPAACIALVVGVYAVTHQETWNSSQALIVRNEAFGVEKRLGKFSYPEEMKTVQETILELLKSRGVLEAALREVGPPADCRDPKAWPGELDIADIRLDVKLAPPKGAEFGKTEVFYLNVKANDRARSLALSEAIFKQLELQSQSLRDAKAQSMIEELQKTVQVAKTDLDGATATLTATETRLGSDLAELRSMQDMASSDSALRRDTEGIRAQLRDNAVAENANQELLTVLEAARNDPGSLLTTSNRLLESQPSLKRLKDGLVDAQLRTAKLRGNMSAEHPQIKAALETETEIGRHLHNELALAIAGVKLELRLNSERCELLNEQLATALQRLDRLAAARAPYANEVAEVKYRSALLERAEQNMAEARGAQASAKASSLLSRIDAPDAGIRPVGPSRAMIALGGVVGGLLTGFGLVFLCAPLRTAEGKPHVLVATPTDNGPHPADEPRPDNACADSLALPRANRDQRHAERLTLKEALQKLAGTSGVHRT